MVRETRHLKVSNLPQDITEDKVLEYFRRYGRVQKADLQNGESLPSAIVSFMDIKSASKVATDTSHELNGKTITVSYYEPGAATTSAVIEIHENSGFLTAASSSRGITNGPSSRFSSSQGDYQNICAINNSSASGECDREPTSSGASYSRSSANASGSREVCSSDDRRDFTSRRGTSNRHSNTAATTSSSQNASNTNNNYKTGSSNAVTGTQRRSPSRQSGLNSFGNGRRDRRDRSLSSNGSRQSSPATSQADSHGTASPRSGASRSDGSGGRDRKIGGSSEQHHRRSGLVGENSLPAVIVRGLPIRSNDRSIKDGLYHKFKKHGKVMCVKVIGEDAKRYALITFLRHTNADKIAQETTGNLFLGGAISVTSAPPELSDSAPEDNERKPLTKDYDRQSSKLKEFDEFQLQSSRTLYVGSLEGRVTESYLRDLFCNFGEILDVDVKNPESPHPFAFVQFSDISSVVKAINKMDSEYAGQNRCKPLKLGFGKSMPAPSVWIGGVPSSWPQAQLLRKVSSYGTVRNIISDRESGQAIVVFELLESAKDAIADIKQKQTTERQLQIDFASREFQEYFASRTGQPCYSRTNGGFTDGQCYGSSGLTLAGDGGNLHMLRQFNRRGGRPMMRGMQRRNNNFLYEFNNRVLNNHNFDGLANGGSTSSASNHYSRRSGGVSRDRSDGYSRNKGRSLTPPDSSQNSRGRSSRSRTPLAFPGGLCVNKASRDGGRSDGDRSSSAHRPALGGSGKPIGLSNGRRSRSKSSRSSSRHRSPGGHRRGGENAAFSEDRAASSNRSEDGRRRHANRPGHTAANNNNGGQWPSPANSSRLNNAKAGSVSELSSPRRGAAKTSVSLNNRSSPEADNRRRLGSSASARHQQAKQRLSTSGSAGRQTSSRRHRSSPRNSEEDSSDDESSSSSDDDSRSSSSSSTSSSSSSDDEAANARKSNSRSQPQEISSVPKPVIGPVPVALTLLQQQQKQLDLNIKLAMHELSLKSAALNAPPNGTVGDPEVMKLHIEREKLLHALENLKEDPEARNSPANAAGEIGGEINRKLKELLKLSYGQKLPEAFESALRSQHDNHGSTASPIPVLIKGVPQPSLHYGSNSSPAKQRCLSLLSPITTIAPPSAIPTVVDIFAESPIKEEMAAASWNSDSQGIKKQTMMMPSNLINVSRAKDSHSSALASTTPSPLVANVEPFNSNVKPEVTELADSFQSDKFAVEKQELNTEAPSTSGAKPGTQKTGSTASSATLRKSESTEPGQNTTASTTLSQSHGKLHVVREIPLEAAESAKASLKDVRLYKVTPASRSRQNNADLPLPRFGVTHKFSKAVSDVAKAQAIASGARRNSSAMISPLHTTASSSPAADNILSRKLSDPETVSSFGDPSDIAVLPTSAEPASYFGNHSFSSPQSPASTRPSFSERLKSLDDKFHKLEDTVKSFKETAPLPTRSALSSSCAGVIGFSAAAASAIPAVDYTKKYTIKKKNNSITSSGTPDTPSATSQPCTPSAALPAAPLLKDHLKSSIFDGDIQRLSTFEDKYRPDVYRCDSTSSAVLLNSTPTTPDSAGISFGGGLVGMGANVLPLAVPLTLNIPSYTAPCSAAAAKTSTAMTPIITPPAPAHGILKKTPLTPLMTPPGGAFALPNVVGGLPQDPRLLISPTTPVVPPVDPRLAKSVPAAPAATGKPMNTSGAAPPLGQLSMPRPIGTTPVQAKPSTPQFSFDQRPQQQRPGFTNNNSNIQAVQRSTSLSGSTPNTPLGGRGPATAAGSCSSSAFPFSAATTPSTPSTPSSYTANYVPAPQPRADQKTFGHSHAARQPAVGQSAATSASRPGATPGKSAVPPKELKNQELEELFKAKDGDRIKSTTKEKINLPKIAKKAPESAISSQPADTSSKGKTANKNSSDSASTASDAVKKPDDDKYPKDVASKEKDRKRTESETVAKTKEKDKSKQLKTANSADAASSSKKPSSISKESIKSTSKKDSSSAKKPNADAKSPTKKSAVAKRTGGASSSESSDSDSCDSDSYMDARRSTSHLSKEWQEVIACLGDEPVCLSMYDRVKRRSSAMRPEPAQRSSSSKFSKLKEKRLGKDDVRKKPRRVRVSDDESGGENNSDSGNSSAAGGDKEHPHSEGESSEIRAAMGGSSAESSDDEDAKPTVSSLKKEKQDAKPDKKSAPKQPQAKLAGTQKASGTATAPGPAKKKTSVVERKQSKEVSMVDVEDIYGTSSSSSDENETVDSKPTVASSNKKLSVATKPAISNEPSSSAAKLAAAKQEKNRRRGRPPGRKPRSSPTSDRSVSQSETPTSEAACDSPAVPSASVAKLSTQAAASKDSKPTTEQTSKKAKKTKEPVTTTLGREENADSAGKKRKVGARPSKLSATSSIDDKPSAQSEPEEPAPKMSKKEEGAKKQQPSEASEKSEKKRSKEEREKEKREKKAEKKRKREAAQAAAESENVDDSGSAPPTKKKKHKEKQKEKSEKPKKEKKDKTKNGGGSVMSSAEKASLDRSSSANSIMSVPTKAAKKIHVESSNSPTLSDSVGEFRVKTKAAMKSHEPTPPTSFARLNRQEAIDEPSDSSFVTDSSSQMKSRLDAATLESMGVSPDHIALALQNINTDVDECTEPSGLVELSIAEVVVTDGNAIILPDGSADVIMTTSSSCGSVSLGGMISPHSTTNVNLPNVYGDSAARLVSPKQLTSPSSSRSSGHGAPTSSATDFEQHSSSYQQQQPPLQHPTSEIDQYADHVFLHSPPMSPKAPPAKPQASAAAPQHVDHVNKIIEDVVHGYVEIEPQELIKLSAQRQQEQQQAAAQQQRKTSARERNASFSMATPTSVSSAHGGSGYGESSKDSTVQAALPTSLQRQSVGPSPSSSTTAANTSRDIMETIAAVATNFGSGAVSVNAPAAHAPVSTALPQVQSLYLQQQQQQQSHQFTPSSQQQQHPTGLPMMNVSNSHTLPQQHQQPPQSVSANSESSVALQRQAASLQQQHQQQQQTPQQMESLQQEFLRQLHQQQQQQQAAAARYATPTPATVLQHPSSEHLKSAPTTPVLPPNAVVSRFGIPLPQAEAKLVPNAASISQQLPAQQQQQLAALSSQVSAAASLAGVPASVLYGNADASQQVRALMQQHALWSTGNPHLMAQQAAALRNNPAAVAAFMEQELHVQRLLQEQQRQQQQQQQLRNAVAANVVTASQQQSTSQHHSLALDQQAHSSNSTAQQQAQAAALMRQQQQLALQQQQQQPPAASGNTFRVLVQRYPIVWQGHLALKNDQALVQMHFISGNRRLPPDSLPTADAPTTPILRVAQRMRLESQQLEGVARRMQNDEDHCLLLALPCGRDQPDIIHQSSLLQSGFITYLQQKQAAGIVNVSQPNDPQPAFVVHIFPPCDFAKKHFITVADDFHRQIQERSTPFLLIVIATCS